MYRSVPALFCQCKCRPSEAELLGLSHLDPETQQALFPHLPHTSAASKHSTWKWSDIGSAPVLHAFAKEAHAKPLTALATAAEAAAGTAAHAQGASAAAEDAAAALGQIPKAGTGSRNRHHRTATQYSSHDTSPSPGPEPENYLVALLGHPLLVGAPPPLPLCPSPNPRPSRGPLTTLVAAGLSLPRQSLPLLCIRLLRYVPGLAEHPPQTLGLLHGPCNLHLHHIRLMGLAQGHFIPA